MPEFSPHVCVWTRPIGATFPGFHNKVNTLTETTHKPSLTTRLRDLVAGDSGFTLLETLAVMVIIGLLAAITVPQIAKWREKAYITSMKTDARNIANAIEVFYVDKQTYPTIEEYMALQSSDVKLNPSNISVWYYYYGGNNFYFYIRSNKTDSRVRYVNNDSPTITVETVP